MTLTDVQRAAGERLSRAMAEALEAFNEAGAAGLDVNAVVMESLTAAFAEAGAEVPPMLRMLAAG